VKKINSYILSGVFLNSLWLVSNQFQLLPSFIEGLALGLGLVLMAVGMSGDRFGMGKVRRYKLKLVKGVMGK